MQILYIILLFPLMYSFKFRHKFSVSHCGIQKPQCGIHISHCEIQIPQCETENSSKRFELCFSEFVIMCRERWNFLIEIIGYAINLYNFVLQAYRGYDWGGLKCRNEYGCVSGLPSSVCKFYLLKTKSYKWKI